MIDETVEQIEDMRTHSSSEVAITAIEALKYTLDGDHATVEEYLRSLTRNCRALRHADPSHASLFSATKSVESTVLGAEPETIDDARSVTLAAIDSEIATITQAKERAAEAAAKLLEEDSTYVTIDYSTTFLEALNRAEFDPETPATVYAMEARPRILGRKMARKMATIEGVKSSLIVDNAVGKVIDGCDGVFVGMTCVIDDVLYNRVGTYPLALVADAHDVPMYAVGADTKVVDEAFVFSSEERPTSEVSLEPLDDVHIENHMYDTTPIGLFDGVITDAGIRFSDV